LTTEERIIRMRVLTLKYAVEAGMLIRYMRAAIGHAEYRKLDDGAWFADIPGFQGVWANAASVEDCRSELEEVLGEWLLLKIRAGDPLPVVDGVELKITAEVAS